MGKSKKKSRVRNHQIPDKQDLQETLPEKWDKMSETLLMSMSKRLSTDKKSKGQTNK